LLLVSCFLWQRHQTVVGPCDSRSCLLFLQPIRGCSRVRGWSVAPAIGSLLPVLSGQNARVKDLVTFVGHSSWTATSTGVMACCRSHSMDIWILFSLHVIVGAKTTLAILLDAECWDWIVVSISVNDVSVSEMRLLSTSPCPSNWFIK